MSDIVKLQRQFQNYLLGNDDSIVLEIEGVHEPAERLAVYKNAYRLRLQTALCANYPMVLKYVGNDCFDRITDAYITTYPSENRSIRWFGDRLCEFLKTPLSRDVPGLADLALWEWCCGCVMDAAASQTISFDVLSAIPPEKWENIQFTMHPSLRVLTVNKETVKIWQALCNDKQPRVSKKNDAVMDCMMWRQAGSAQFSSLSAPERYLLDNLVAGKTLQMLCDGVCDFFSEDEAASFVSDMLKNWISIGLIADIAYD